MKQIALGAATLAAGFISQSASAQSNVTVYGLIDAGIEYVTHTNAAGDSLVKMPSVTGSLPSRIGFKGTEDLGGGLKALFTLETGLSPNNGVVGQGGRIFGRQASVGLQGDWGTLTLGRQVNMTYLVGFKADVMGPNIHAIGSLDPYLPNARSDNAIGYLGKFSDFTVGATWSFGRDASSAGGPAATNCAGQVAGDSKACRQYTAMVDYDNKAWGVAAAYDRLYGGAGAAGGLTSSDFYDQRISLNGFVMFGKTRVGVGMIQRKTQTAVELDRNLYYAGVSLPLADSWVLDAQASKLDTKDSPNDTTLLTARLVYSLSKRTATYVSLGRVNNSGTAALAVDAGGTVGAGMSQVGIMTGIRHFF
jgi:predicted porin